MRCDYSLTCAFVKASSGITSNRQASLSGFSLSFQIWASAGRYRFRPRSSSIPPSPRLHHMPYVLARASRKLVQWEARGLVVWFRPASPNSVFLFLTMQLLSPSGSSPRKTPAPVPRPCWPGPVIYIILHRSISLAEPLPPTLFSFKAGCMATTPLP